MGCSSGRSTDRRTRVPDSPHLRGTPPPPDPLQRGIPKAPGLAAQLLQPPGSASISRHSRRPLRASTEVAALRSCDLSR
ncbi:hypothetical protein NDU88_004289 [Pleurodeles waltl]|uniref:Uncharacterized protein n=1 Tax=Pleurodeles waltl TaxID=8319 RepID=A0AAV7W8L6_PLEWA|nr:hypothetical protein NDU88_004289 [Pleurodeles waltl]